MEKKTVKFITKGEFQNGTHWSYCEEKKIPYIEISEQTAEWSNVSYDLFHCNVPNSSEESFVDMINSIYDSFVVIFRIPEEKASFAGGNRNGNFVVRTKHSEFIAENLYDFFVHLETIIK